MNDASIVDVYHVGHVLKHVALVSRFQWLVLKRVASPWVFRRERDELNWDSEIARDGRYKRDVNRKFKASGAKAPRRAK